MQFPEQQPVEVSFVVSKGKDQVLVEDEDGFEVTGIDPRMCSQ